MPDQMWPLARFRFDEAIDADDVHLFDEDEGEMILLSKKEAIARAHGSGMHLIAWWPSAPGDTTPSCIIGKVAEPLRWEQAPTDLAPVDEDLWFEAPCGGRDFLLDGSGHTFRGRMAAWCPARDLYYSVSLSEMGEMAAATGYFIRGFLAGNQPAPPDDDDGYMTDEDEAAWRAATRRFRRTGFWYGRWGTCSQCGSVLLPDSASKYCESHEPRDG